MQQIPKLYHLGHAVTFKDFDLAGRESAVYISKKRQDLILMIIQILHWWLFFLSFVFNVN